MTRPSKAVTSVPELVEAGFADPAEADMLHAVTKEFRIRITPEMQQPATGIAAQFVPDKRELLTRPEELADPIGDTVHSPASGLTHRYPDRAILHVTQTCDVYCRFCFRREVVGAAGPLPADQLDAALDYIARTPQLREIILTGGDPLTLSPRRLTEIMQRLDAIPHIEILRLHSRVPVVTPDRIAGLLPALRCVRAAVFLVIHTNHPDELTASAREAISRLADHGIPLLSQSVLLRGVNDDAGILARLFRDLTALRVTPYYLHHCDLARGTSHFRTTIREGLDIIASLRGHLSGIAIPSYVLDLPGGFGKVPLDSNAVIPTSDGHWRITDWRGQVHDYTDPKR
ncbi:lysine-2,3-aminomutase-like protein [Paracoccus aerodenitrificans]|uniref:lysine-2,3-aminomutase-like protein n=1 Tax=Paracoccus aerodenitrificans TaxID=3017781 RepID=UPI0022F02E00|nr:lysine-2,3-aminomutase-like protein [Paracoccus aerodenitrificans]WBU63014.1 lysine-2,3-aminomutase-like protein [Paracoccus aerodenitrificans]